MNPGEYIAEPRKTSTGLTVWKNYVCICISGNAEPGNLLTWNMIWRIFLLFKDNLHTAASQMEFV